MLDAIAIGLMFLVTFQMGRLYEAVQSTRKHMEEQP